jgi:hypothetical protein
MNRASASTIASFAAAFLLALALGGTAVAQSATAMTDRADYAPGETVTITGSGWQPGETVTLSFVESPLLDTHPDLTAVADTNGSILNNQFSPDAHDVDIAFTLTATGGTSGLQAQTTFTDAITLDTVSVGSQVGIITTGIVGSASYAVCITYHGSNSAVSFSVISGLPSGVTSSFSPNPTPTNPSQCPTTATTLTLTTTAAVAAGTYTFTVQATGGGTVTSTGTLLVAGSASKLVFTNALVTVTAGVCSAALTVQSRDSSGNPSNVTSTETLAPSASPSAGASFYTDNTCTTVVTGSNLTIPSGSNSASFFFKDTAPGSVLITVTGTGAFATGAGANAATQTETINAATARRGQTIVATLSSVGALHGTGAAVAKL